VRAKCRKQETWPQREAIEQSILIRDVPRHIGPQVTDILLLTRIGYSYFRSGLHENILGWILERWDGVMWTGLVWLRIGTGGELL
jgi:hypothetical protein